MLPLRFFSVSHGLSALLTALSYSCYVLGAPHSPSCTACGSTHHHPHRAESSRPAESSPDHDLASSSFSLSDTPPDSLSFSRPDHLSKETTPASTGDVLSGERLDDGAREQIQHEIRQHLLAKLGMSRPPSAEEIARANISGDDIRDMFRRYNESVQAINATSNRDGDVDSDNDQDDDHDPVSYLGGKSLTRHQGNTHLHNVSFTRWYASPLSAHNASGNLRLVFPPRFPRGVSRTVDRATLRLFVIPQQGETSQDSETVLISVYQLLAPQDDPTPRRLLSIKRIMLTGPGWVSFPVKEAVEMWLNEPNTNMGLEVECSALLGSRLTVGGFIVDDHGTWLDRIGENRHPRIVIVSRSGSEMSRERQRRHNRVVPDASCVAGRGGEASGCCRRDLIVSFRELNYTDWILAPLEYNAYYCAGHCAQLDHVANTHAMLRVLLRMTNPASSPQLCCAPSELGRLNVVHFYLTEDNEVKPKLTAIPNMVVDRCSCT